LVAHIVWEEEEEVDTAVVGDDSAFETEPGAAVVAMLSNF
jgi:hypothetical protein